MKQTNKVLSMVLFMILIVGVCGVVSAANVYKPINQPNVATGNLYVTVLCHHNLFSKEMVLVNNIAPDVNITIKLHPDGTYDGDFVGGNYTLTLLDGNAGHPETKSFVIRNGYRQDVTFIGHAVSFDHGCPLGQERVNGVCVQKECDTGMRLNEKSGECDPIVCPVGTQLVGNECDPIVCPIGEEFVEGQCVPIVCDTGMTFNETSGECDPIVCPVGTQLVGNECDLIICESGYHLVGNECVIDGCNPIVSILSALYGATIQKCTHILVNESYNITVVDVPAYTYHNVSTYELITPGIPAYVEKYGNFTLEQRGRSHVWYAIFVGAGNGTHNVVSTDDCGQYERAGNSDNYKEVKGDNCGDFNIVSAFIDHPAVPAVYGYVVTEAFVNGTCPVSVRCTHAPICEEVNVPAVTHEETIPAEYDDVCVNEDHFYDATSDVQGLVDGGQTSFFFSNALNPGGIFAPGTTSDPLITIADPIYGTVKTATITYSVSCGGIQNAEVSGSEGVVITLDTSVPTVA